MTISTRYFPIAIWNEMLHVRLHAKRLQFPPDSDGWGIENCISCRSCNLFPPLLSRFPPEMLALRMKSDFWLFTFLKEMSRQISDNVYDDWGCRSPSFRRLHIRWIIRPKTSVGGCSRYMREMRALASKQKTKLCYFRSAKLFILSIISINKKLGSVGGRGRISLQCNVENLCVSTGIRNVKERKINVVNLRNWIWRHRFEDEIRFARTRRQRRGIKNFTELIKKILKRLLSLQPTLAWWKLKIHENYPHRRISPSNLNLLP